MTHLHQTFSWTIHNFDMAPHATGEYLESPYFGSNILENSKFSLLLYPRGIEDQSYVSLFLKEHCDNAVKSTSLHLEYEVRVTNASGDPIGSGRQFISLETEFGKCATEGIPKLFERSLLFGFSKNRFLSNNELTVSCWIHQAKFKNNSEHFPGFDNFLILHLSGFHDFGALSLDFAALLESGIHSDLTIEVGEEKFSVHRVILEARCPELLSQLVMTGNSDVMALTNVEAPVLQAILHYIYTGTFKYIDKHEEVFVAAARYNLDILKKRLFPRPNFMSVKTVIDCIQVTFAWRISDFKNFSQPNKEHSYFLVADGIHENSWMKVSIFAEEREGQTVTFLKFQKLRNPCTGALYFKIQTYGENRRLILFKESLNVFENGKLIVPFDNGTDSVKLSKHGNLNLRISIRATANHEKSPVQEHRLIFDQFEQVLPDKICEYNELGRDMLKFHTNMKTGDVTLNIGPKKLPAHKAVLCSRSEVFCMMFQHDSLESQTNSVNIQDVDEETMTSVLNFMYCGATHHGLCCVDHAIPFYSAADKYQILSLKKKCCDYLKSNIDVENFGDVFLLADSHSDDGLKQLVYRFISAHVSEIVQSQRGLKVLENKGDLYQDILNIHACQEKQRKLKRQK